jgi:hypothetical protein
MLRFERRQMEPNLREIQRSDRFEDTELKQTFAGLERENDRLRKLVVRLSETILRNVADRR